MQKCVSDYLDAVCDSLRGKELRQAARTELTDHIMEQCKVLTEQGWDAEPAAKESVAKMGDPNELGKRIAAANTSRAGLINLICGVGLAIIGLAYIVFIGGGSLFNFYDFPSLIIVITLSKAYALVSCKGKLSVLTFLHSFKTGALYSGVISMMVGCIIMLINFSDPDALGPGLAVALVSILYGCLFSAAASAIERRLAAPKTDLVRKLLEQ